jgi:5-methylcytosine-specific restriction endonuclease McrA
MTTKLETLIHKDQVALLDSSYLLTGIVPWERAVVFLVSDKAYTVLARSDGSVIRSMNLTIPRPLVVGLHKYVGLHEKHFEPDDTVSKSVILERDEHVCWICGGYGNEVEHLLPRSRGGLSTYGNLAAACRKCNQTKNDLTPKEIGLDWPYIPKTIVSRRKVAIQEAIYSALGAEG